MRDHIDGIDHYRRQMILCIAQNIILNLLAKIRINYFYIPYIVLQGDFFSF